MNIEGLVCQGPVLHGSVENQMCLRCLLKANFDLTDALRVSTTVRYTEDSLCLGLPDRTEWYQEYEHCSLYGRVCYIEVPCIELYL